MLKKSAKFWVLFLTVCMILSSTACSNERDTDRKSDSKDEDMEAIDDKDFEDIMEDLDYEVYEGPLDEGVVTDIYAYDVDMNYYVTFEEFEDEEDAIDEFEDAVYDVMDVKDGGEFDGYIRIFGSGNYRKAVVKGSFDENSDMFDGEVYIVMIRVDNILIYAYSASIEDANVDEIKHIIKELGYFSLDSFIFDF